VDSTSVLFVCLGNICRSPLAEGIFVSQIRDQNLSSRFLVDSCGTGGWHAGESPHAGSISIARERGLDISMQRSRKLRPSDFERFDWLIAMDASNERHLRDAAPSRFNPERIVRLLDFASNTEHTDVPDPYYVGGFDVVFDLIDNGCRGLLAHLTDTS
jgi:protein-tyrosine phosphatase